jgi:sortase A
MNKVDQDESPSKKNDEGEEKAVSMLRQKIAHLYSDEPDAKEESLEAEAAGKQRSKHQQFMHKLTTSGRSLADIQTAWHEYYVNLPDKEKHEVWQEFYAEHNKSTAKNNPQIKPKETADSEVKHSHRLPEKPAANDTRTPSEIKSTIRKKTSRKPSKKQHLKSLSFGLILGCLMIVFMLFGFFNERFVAPFISPSKSVSNTPIIIDPSSSAVGPEPKIIIPKINVEIPVVYDQPSVAEKDIQESLEKGVVHYSTTPMPGEIGNAVIFGHSSNNILNQGKYKFAFVLLRELDEGDTFYLHKDGKRYVYKITNKVVVDPTDVSILYKKTDKSTVTLITCDPPGTSLKRLLVTGEQISPDPATNVASNIDPSSAEQVAVIPSNAPSLWQRIKDLF